MEDLNFTALNQWFDNQNWAFIMWYGAHMQGQSGVARSGPLGNLLIFLSLLNGHFTRVAFKGMAGKL